MTATVETLEGLERRLNLTLDMPAIEAEVSKRLQKLARNVKMDGFRPGKAPIKVVTARYGGEVRGEVLGDVLQDRFVQEVREQKLNVAGYPSFQPAKDESGNVVFQASFEVYPTVQIGDIGQVKVTRPVVEVGDADIDRTLDVLRKQRVQYHAVQRPAQTGDRVHLDYVGRTAGEVFEGGEAKDFPVVLGEGRTLKDFEGALMGISAGESKTFDVTFPDGYFAKNLAGKTATFEVTAKSVHEARLPEVDEAFAQSMGIHEGGPAKLREEVAANLGREAKRRIQAKVKEQVMDGLLAVTPFDVPKSLVAMETQSLLKRAVTDLKARGMREQDIKMTESVFEPQAKRRVAIGLLLNALANANQIKAGEAEVRAMVDEFAQSYEDPAEVVEWYYQDANRLREAESLVLEDNIVNWVLERAQVTDAPTSLEQLMGKA
jgi:trigger factor